MSRANILPLLSLCLWTATPMLGDEPFRLLVEERAVALGQRIDFDFPVADVRVVGREAETARVEVRVVCNRSTRRCERAMEDLEVDFHQQGDRLVLDLDFEADWPRALDIELVAYLPATSPLVIDGGIGDVQIEGMREDLLIDLGIGRVRVEAGERSFQSVEVDTGIGRSRLEQAGEKVAGGGFFLGSELSWREGSGAARIRIDLGIGETVVDLL